MNNETRAQMLNMIVKNEEKHNSPRPIDYAELANCCPCDDLKYYRGKWYSYSYEHKGYEPICEEEVNQSITEALLKNDNLKVAVSSDLRRDVLSAMQTTEQCGLSARKYQMPCIIPSGADASRILLMKNGYVSIDKIMDTMKAHRPRPKTEWTTPDIFSTWTKGYDYVSTAKCPNFLKFLKEVQPAQANREALQKMAGLCLIPNCSYEKVFVFCGPAGSGKSTLLKVLKAMLGNECCCSVPLRELPNVSNGALLTEKLVNISSDMSLGAESERIEAFLKAIASGEEIPVEQQDGSGIHMTNAMVRCIFETNNLPHFADKSNGVWERLYPIPFNHVFRGTARQNPHLADELIAHELSGILNWALEGLFKVLQQSTLPLTEESWKALVEWRLECDSVGAFLMDSYVVDPNKAVKHYMMHDYYTRWMNNHGVSSVVEETEFMKDVLKMFPSAYFNDSACLQGIFYRK